MSLDRERIVIANLIVSNTAPLDKIGLDGDPIATKNNTGFITVTHGEAVQKSFGKVGSNLYHHPAVLILTIITDGARGAAGATALADRYIDLFHNLKLDESGNQPSDASAMILDFSNFGISPHANGTPEAPHYRTVITAPFNRIERK